MKPAAPVTNTRHAFQMAVFIEPAVLPGSRDSVEFLVSPADR